MIELLLAALLALFPHTPAYGRILQQRDHIISEATIAAQTYNVPPSVLLSVGFHETHLGTDYGEGGNWGAPIDARHRHTAGTAHSAARILARGYEYCHHSWRGAIGFFRSGICAAPRNQNYVNSVVRTVNRLHQRTNTAPPQNL